MNDLSEFSNIHVLVLGDIMLDRYIWGNVERISPEGPIPVVHVQKRTSRLGGAGNVAANLAGLGCNITLAGIIGEDPAGQEITRLLENQNIKDACISVPDLPTVSKTRIIGGVQQIARIDEEQPEYINASTRKKVWDIVFKSLPEVQAVVISDYGKGLLDQELLQKCISTCKKLGISIFVDPKRTDWTSYSGATCITPNLKEFAQACERLSLSSAEDPEHAAVSLINYYNLEALLLTKGKAGMSLIRAQGDRSSVSSTAQEVFDVSGAGDTVISIMAASVASGLSMEQAMRLANLGAGEVVGHVGTYAITQGDLLKARARNAYMEKSLVSWPWKEASQMVSHWQSSGQQVVFTNGCFDLLHPGHISLLQRAKALGDRLVIGLNTDNSIKRIKGLSRPILSEQDRAKILASLDCVDMVVCFDEDTPIELLKLLRPDVLVKGGDYTKSTVVGADLVEDWGGRVELIQLVEGQSTSGIIEKIYSNT